MKAVPVKMSDDLNAQVEELASLYGEPKSTMMRMAMRIGIESLVEAKKNASKKVPPAQVARD